MFALYQLILGGRVGDGWVLRLHPSSCDAIHLFGGGGRGDDGVI